MSWRERLEPVLTRAWQGKGALARSLYPLTYVYRALHAANQALARPERLPVPVLVIGNLTVGGAGKTPLTIELARRLRARGWNPGIVSRGYGAENHKPRMVDLRGNTADYGDEPVLISMTTQLPVAVGAQRIAAGKLLLNLHPDRDLLIADDGLQHRRLARDVEIAVIHGDSLGNGWLLPAGPLRESPERLRSVDLVVFHGAPVAVRVHSPFFVMQSGIAKAQSLVDTTRGIALKDLAAEQRRGNLRLVALAGIARPERFFDMLRGQGLEFEAIALPDHYDYRLNPLAGRNFDCALLTEKDAVKCRANASLASDGRICAVPLQVTIDDALVDCVENLLKAVAPRNHGLAPA
ncbi:MAG TPA: tetraacyldisaccharide 4'-kinase [Burkholderiaceae bacterium]|nr:tetraacyldisaccharide 4'-kinase [Burkholderiaceae bacterium]